MSSFFDFNRTVRAELRKYLREGLLEPDTYHELRERYPVQPWNWLTLGRWFLILGSLTLAAGMAVYFYRVFEFTLRKLVVLEVLAMVACGVGSWFCRTKKMKWTWRTLELLGGLTLIGLSFTLGAIYSSGSGNWPLLLRIDLFVLFPLTYLLVNPLLLILSLVTFFFWFGGMTGYVSGWGMYWLGMNYPLRFLTASGVMVLFSLVHLSFEQGFFSRYRGFFKIWLSLGLFFGEMSLWVLSIFGNYGEVFGGYSEPLALELLIYNTVWCLLNILLVFGGKRFRFGMLTGYGVTYGIIQVYTLYFTYLAEELGVIMSFFLVGGSTLVLMIVLEQQLDLLRADNDSAS